MCNVLLTRIWQRERTGVCWCVCMCPCFVHMWVCFMRLWMCVCLCVCSQWAPDNPCWPEWKLNDPLLHLFLCLFILMRRWLHIKPAWQSIRHFTVVYLIVLSRSKKHPTQDWVEFTFKSPASSALFVTVFAFSHFFTEISSELCDFSLK